MKFAILMTTIALLSPSNDLNILGGAHKVTEYVSYLLQPEEVVEEEVAAVSYGNRWGIYPTEDETYYLACILWLEARGEPNAGQQAVVEVVFNRVCHPAFEWSIVDVLAEPGEFVTWDYWYTAEPTDKEYANIQAVVDGQTWWTDWNTVYFATSPYGDYVYDVIGNHYFCNTY